MNVEKRQKKQRRKGHKSSKTWNVRRGNFVPKHGEPFSI